MLGRALGINTCVSKGKKWKQNWAGEKLECDRIAEKISANPTGRSEAGMVLPLKLGKTSRSSGPHIDASLEINNPRMEYEIEKGDSSWVFAGKPGD